MKRPAVVALMMPAVLMPMLASLALGPNELELRAALTGIGTLSGVLMMLAFRWFPRRSRPTLSSGTANASRASIEISAGLEQSLSLATQLFPQPVREKSRRVAQYSGGFWGQRLVIEAEPLDEARTRLVVSVGSDPLAAFLRPSANQRELEALVVRLRAAAKQAALQTQEGSAPSVTASLVGWPPSRKTVLLASLSVLGVLVVLLAMGGLSSQFVAATVVTFATLGWAGYQGRKHRLLSNSAEGSMVVSLPPDRVLEIVADSIAEPGQQLDGASLRFSRGISWWSFGEDVEISVESLSPETTRLQVSSRSSAPTAVDWGANRDNVARVLARCEGPLLTAAAVQGARTRAALANVQNIEVQLARLQAQSDAHFLYNTLTHIAVLTEQDAPSARRMIEELVAFLRASAQVGSAGRTTLGQECELVERYLVVMRHRLGERLHTSCTIPPELAPQPCLPGVVLTLVENAVKHGIEPSSTGGTVSVRVLTDADFVVLEVADTGVGFGATLGEGLGLSNLKERLATRYGAAGTLVLEQNEPHGVVARLRFPSGGR